MPESASGASSDAKDLKATANVLSATGIASSVSKAIADGMDVKVGHAGLYWEEDGTAHLQEKSGDDTIVDTTVELGVSGKGKLLKWKENY